MRRMHTMVLAAALSMALIGSAASCSSDATSPSADDGTTSTTSGSRRTFEVSTTDGQISLSLDGELPRGWPDTFPVPEGVAPAGSGSFVNGGTGQMVGVFTGSLSPQDAFDFYASSTAYTVDDPMSVGAGSAYVGTVQFSGTWEGRVTVLSKGGSTTIVVVIDAGSDANTSATGASGTTVAP